MVWTPPMRSAAARLLARVALVLSPVGAASAAESHVVIQQDKAFRPNTVQAEVGDTVVFANEDIFAHNMYSETPGHEFNIRKQMPGERDSVTLERPGEIEVRCAIHPRMRLRIVVD